MDKPDKMDKQRKQKQLGRGLSALLGDGTQEYTGLDAAKTDDTAKTAQVMAVSRLRPCPLQPRRKFNKAHLAELAQSIKEKGILQPLVVRPIPDGRPGYKAGYEIICGERRWRAAQAAMVHEVPVMIRAVSDQDALEIALIENLQRENLSALDEAEAYQRLMADFGHTQDAMAQTIGKSRSHVANMVRLLSLPNGVKVLLAEGKLSAGHGRALLSAKDPPATAKTVINENLSVRETEDLIRRETKPGSDGKAKPSAPRRKAADKAADTVALERELADLTGLKTEIRSQGAAGDAGQIAFRYGSLDELDALIARLR